MNIHRFLLGAAVAVLMIFLAEAAQASSLAISDASPDVAAARLGTEYGVEIQIPANTAGRVTMTLETDAGTRLQAVNALANALGLDFTKSYVVQKSADGQAMFPQVDSTTSVPFGKTTLPAAEAIALVAGVDDASAVVAGDVDGTITLSAVTLPAGQAAQEIAEQTKTSWRTIYVLAPRPSDPARAGRLVGYTTAGTPIFVMPAIYFIDWKKNAQIRREEEAAERLAEQQAEQAQAAALQQASQQQQTLTAAEAVLRSAGAGGVPPNGYGPNGGPAPYGASNGGNASNGPYGYGNPGYSGPNNTLIFSGNGF